MTTHAMTVYKEVLDGRSLISRFNRGKAVRQMRYPAQRSFALQIIQASEALRECSPESIHNCMLDIAFTGLTLAPSRSLLYLIPYGGKATLAIGYRGMEQLAFRTGVVESIQAALVCENDPIFVVGTGRAGRYVKHEEARADRGDVTHAYCVACFSNGKQHVEVMDREQLEAVEEAATKRNPRGGAVWKSRFKGEMQKKAVIRRAWKHWPHDDDGRRTRTTTSRTATLTDLCAEHDISTDTVCRAFGVASLSLIPDKDYDEAVRMVAPV